MRACLQKVPDFYLRLGFLKVWFMYCADRRSTSNDAGDGVCAKSFFGRRVKRMQLFFRDVLPRGRRLDAARDHPTDCYKILEWGHDIELVTRGTTN